MIRYRVVPLVLLAGAAVSCRAPDARPAGAPVTIPAPLGLPPVPIPAGNPPTAAAVSLGKRLYFDTALSRDNNISCASCHRPDSAFGDPRAVSEGVGGVKGRRNAPTVLNAAYWPSQFWDGRAATLEEQAAGPISNALEMDHRPAALLARLTRHAEYPALFAAAFGPGRITMDRVCNAIASFERTLLSGNSPFDRYHFGGDKTAMSNAAIRGFELFRERNKGNCAACHTLGERYALFTDGKFHNIGAGMSPSGELRDLGRFEQTKIGADRGAFRTPSLRNVARTAPYMHDGSLRTLRDVVDFYAGGGNSNPHLDPEIRPLTLTRQERSDIVAFLEALNGDLPDTGAPR